MRKHAIYVVQVRGCYRFLRLNNLNVVAHAGVKALPGEVKVLLANLNVLYCYFDLIGCCLQIQERVANFALDPSPDICELRPPLNQSSFGLFDISLGAASLPDWYPYCSYHREGTV